MKKEYRGIVQRGTKRAAALGFPTVNITYDAPDVSGIYAATVRADEKVYRAAAYADKKRGILEAHIFDTDLDLYGKEIAVELLKKIREDKVFENDSALRAAIAADVKAIRNYFSKHT